MYLIGTIFFHLEFRVLFKLEWNSIHKSRTRRLMIERFNSLIDAKLQNSFYFKSGYVLELFKNSKSIFWIFDLNSSKPFCDFFEKCPVPLLKEKKPVNHFLKAHALGKRLSQLSASEEIGRGFIAEFGYEDSLKMEVRLFPHGQNLILTCSSKAVSAFPIRKLPEGPVILYPQNYDVQKEEWLKSFQKKENQQDAERVLQRAIEKKQKAIDKTQEALAQCKDKEWRFVGEWLKTHQTLKIPPEYEQFINTEMNFSQNLESIFRKAKDIESKREGMLERLSVLNKELKSLQDGDVQVAQTPKLQKNKSAEKMFPIGESIELYIGRNATENLKILRESQSWHLWMHLKDYPGAHGVLRFAKGHHPHRSEIDQAAQRIAERSQKSHHHIQVGDGFDVLVVEKRFVKPIKGDKLGRVRYTNEQVFTFKKT